MPIPLSGEESSGFQPQVVQPVQLPTTQTGADVLSEVDRSSKNIRKSVLEREAEYIGEIFASWDRGGAIKLKESSDDSELKNTLHAIIRRSKEDGTSLKDQTRAAKAQEIVSKLSQKSVSNT